MQVDQEPSPQQPVSVPTSDAFLTFPVTETTAPLANIFSSASSSETIDIAAAAVSIFPATPPSPFPMSVDLLPQTKTPSNNREPTTVMVPAKRGYKSHVPSACINCKKAHLACDVSRPCKRCVSLGKTDTCHDIKHKKRGRPRLRDKPANDVTDSSGYKVMCGTFQTPTFTLTVPSTTTTTTTATTDTQITTTTTAPAPVSSAPISFIHESFQPVVTSTTNSGTSTTTDELVAAAFDFQDTDDFLQQYVFPTYLPALPIHAYHQTQAPESMSLQMKMESTTMAQRPALPIPPPPPPPPPSAITIFLSMEVCCARVQGNVTESWGYYPQEFAHRPLYDFISPKDKDRLANLHRLLLDNVAEKNNNQTPTATERTTSDLFHKTDLDTVNTVAHGSNTFSDTLHIKKRSGQQEELYKTTVSLGGGFGANLEDPTSLSKLYIIARFEKYQYKISPSSRAFNTSGSNSSFCQTSSSRQNNNNNSSSKPRRPVFPTIRTTTTSRPPIMDPPKVNVAPISNSNLKLRTSFRPIAAALPAIRAPLSSRSESINPYSTLAYRFAAPIAASSPKSSATGSPRGGPDVTHPTTQYFLQTSSSTLNAAASAAQHSSNSSSLTYGSNMADNDKAAGKTDSNRKVEMSIRSLLC